MHTYVWVPADAGGQESKAQAAAIWCGCKELSLGPLWEQDRLNHESSFQPLSSRVFILFISWLLHRFLVFVYFFLHWLFKPFSNKDPFNSVIYYGMCSTLYTVFWVLSQPWLLHLLNGMAASRHRVGSRELTWLLCAGRSLVQPGGSAWLQQGQ